jgi:protein-tyrosine phosphatase
MIKVLFICMGNICRSPTAEVVFRHQAKIAGLEKAILVDSAGTHDYHTGESPDGRAQKLAEQHGYDMKGLRARQFNAEDFNTFHYILSMDKHNLAILNYVCPPQHKYKLGMLMEYSRKFSEYEEVPDPYFGGHQGFERVLKMIEDAGEGLLHKISKKN